jgi:hypothetical protein
VSAVWLVGRQACGCVTRVETEPDTMLAPDRRSWGDFVADGGAAERLPADEARAALGAFGDSCPHDPIGWGPNKGQPNPDRQSSVDPATGIRL